MGPGEFLQPLVDWSGSPFVVSVEVNRVKYILLFCGTPEDQAAFDSLAPSDRGQRYAEVARWFAANKATIVSSNQLQGPHTATSVRFDPSGTPVVKDGPFMEGKEIIGGYCEVDVADLDEALRMAKTWPGRGAVEIRPLVQTRSP
jgi:hypothetical protein